MSITINPISPQDALPLWKDSPHATVFTHPDVLSKLCQRVDWWAAHKGHRPLCAWPVCLPDGNTVGLPELTYYVGPIWSKMADNMPAHRWLSRSTQVYEGFIEIFLQEYGRVHASLPKGLLDVRAFDWWHYHQPDKPRFTIRPRYTACIHDLDKNDQATILADFRQLRRRELRKMEADGPPARSQDWQADDLILLYADVLGRQDIDIQAKNERLIHNLVALVQAGFGEVIAYQDPQDHHIIAACLLLYGHGQANMVLNVVENEWRSTGLPAWMITETIIQAKKQGMTCYDFNGANSPNRGDDKHSYGAHPVLFFEIQYP